MAMDRSPNLYSLLYLFLTLKFLTLCIRSFDYIRQYCTFRWLMGCLRFAYFRYLFHITYLKTQKAFLSVRVKLRFVLFYREIDTYFQAPSLISLMQHDNQSIRLSTRFPQIRCPRVLLANIHFKPHKENIHRIFIVSLFPLCIIHFHPAFFNIVRFLLVCKKSRNLQWSNIR